MTIATTQAVPEALTTIGQVVLAVQTAPPAWTTYFSALLTPSIALLAVVVAIAQWRNARNKLKLDLFDRRHVVYAASVAALHDVCSPSIDPPDGMADRFLTGISGAGWLFGPEVHGYINGALKEHVIGFNLVGQHLRLGVGLTPEAIARLEVARETHRKWCFDEIGKIDERFVKYLTLSH